MSTEKRTITMRGIELREDQGDGTRIEGIAVPFGQRIGLWPGTAEEFAPDCDFGDTTRTKLSRDHGRLIGKITNATREADGLHITAAISDTAEGRDAVQLIRDGEVYDTATLAAGNNWKHSWSGLDASHDWLVREKSVPEGYVVAVERDSTDVTITNTVTRQASTGSNVMVVAGLMVAVASVALVTLAIVRTRRNRN